MNSPSTKFYGINKEVFVMSGDQGSLEDKLSRRYFLQTAGMAALLAGSSAPLIGSRLLSGETQATAPRSADTGKKLRMGIVGGGFGASFPWHEHPNCQVTAVSDL